MSRSHHNQPGVTGSDAQSVSQSNFPTIGPIKELFCFIHMISVSSSFWRLCFVFLTCGISSWWILSDYVIRTETETASAFHTLLTQLKKDNLNHKISQALLLCFQWISSILCVLIPAHHCVFFIYFCFNQTERRGVADVRGGFDYCASSPMMAVLLTPPHKLLLPFRHAELSLFSSFLEMADSSILFCPSSTYVLRHDDGGN